jgi:hypothetical protein
MVAAERSASAPAGYAASQFQFSVIYLFVNFRSLAASKATTDSLPASACITDLHLQRDSAESVTI